VVQIQVLRRHKGHDSINKKALTRSAVVWHFRQRLLVT